MEINAGKNGEIVFSKVYSGMVLQSDAGERMGICMRDSGFEFCYNNIWYSAKEGVVSRLDEIPITAAEAFFS